MLRSQRPARGQELRDLADEELRLLVGEGDARAFELVFDRHGGASFSLAYRICGRRAAAEDVVQEAFLSLWRSGARYQPTRGSVRSWVLAVVHNRAVDALRRGVVREGRDIADEDAVERLAARDSTEGEVARRDEALTVRDALGALPVDQRRVIELAYFGGFTHTQIAELLAVPVGTVKGRMRLGLSKMRLSLGDRAEVTA
jgi:RNA polymerase sigma-70 factor (ECF subfamily)